MSYDEGNVVWINEAGTKRIRAVPDMDPLPPYDDGAMPTFCLNRTTNRFTCAYSYQAELVRGEYGLGHELLSNGLRNPNGPGQDLLNAWRRFDDTFGPNQVLDVFERYLRIFHGTTTVYTYGPNQGTDYKYLTFDTADWRETVGCPEDRADAGEDFEEYRTYIEGGVYGLIYETKVKLHVTTESVAFPARPWEDEESDDWKEEESVWGFYTWSDEELAERGKETFGLDDE